MVINDELGVLVEDGVLLVGEGLEGVEEGEGVEFVRGRVNQVIRLLQHLADVDRVAMVEEILKQRFMTMYARHTIERSGSGVELRTLNYENPGSNPWASFFHSTLLQFTQQNK